MKSNDPINYFFKSTTTSATHLHLSLAKNPTGLPSGSFGFSLLKTPLKGRALCSLVGRNERSAVTALRSSCFGNYAVKP
jgi:hypothetical protein